MVYHPGCEVHARALLPFFFLSFGGLLPILVAYFHVAPVPDWESAAEYNNELVFNLYGRVAIVPQGASNGPNKLLPIDAHCYSYRHPLVSIYVDGPRSYPTGIEYQ